MERFNRKIYGVGARFGTASNYADISTSGAVTYAGTAKKTRSIDISPNDTHVSGSVTKAAIVVSSASFPGALFLTACPASATNPHMAGTFRVPADVDTSVGIAAYAYTSHNTAGASNAAWLMSACYLGTGEAAAPTGASSALTKIDAGVATANAINRVSLGTLGTGFAANDIVKFDLALYCSSGSNAAVNQDVWALEFVYTSAVAY